MVNVLDDSEQTSSILRLVECPINNHLHYYILYICIISIHIVILTVIVITDIISSNGNVYDTHFATGIV